MNDLLNGTEQYYLRRVQLANWGTFSGIHDVDVSKKGHLFVGGSGSGKSTVLDAISVLLTPGRINFNAAARPGEKRSDRSFMSYVRGAWSSEQDSDGRATTKFLRTGSTWSAVALTYQSNLEVTVTLLFIAYVRGAARDEASVKRQYF
ncbi:MAG: ATP-binding protein, partial [Duodenibacillus sp.]|nr:ATP-binding protein [Duodenibacillus sp.]